MGERESLKENEKYIELNGNENTTHQILWESTKVVLRGQFIALNAYIRQKEDS